MSTDAFGNSPAMTHDEMVGAGLVTEDGELTRKGSAILDGSEYITVELDICEPDDVHAWAAGYSCSAALVTETNHWPVYRIGGTRVRVATLLREGYGGLEGEGEAEEFLAAYAHAADPAAPLPIPSTTVEIPGTMLATYTDGAISGWVWMPLASYAGYFGPAARIHHGADADLDVESTDGPFWVAVQQSLIDGGFTPEWEE